MFGRAPPPPRGVLGKRIEPLADSVRVAALVVFVFTLRSRFRILCRYDQRAEALGKKGMIQTDNM